MGKSRVNRKTSGVRNDVATHPYNLRPRKVSKPEEAQTKPSLSARPKPSRNLQKRRKTGNAKHLDGPAPNPNPLPTLPAEICLLILTNLRVSPTDLLRMRLVCHQWKRFVDEILTKTANQCLASSWKPYSQPGKALWLGKEKQMNLVASHFSTWEQLEAALQLPPDRNPFPTGVVIMMPYFEVRLYRYSTDRSGLLQKFCELAPSFLIHFRKWISTLVYFFYGRGEDELYPARLFLDSIVKMENLRNLILYKDEPSISYENGRALLEEIKETGSDLKLSRLHFGYTFSVKITSLPSNGSPLILFLAWLPTVTESVTSLELEWPGNRELVLENSLLPSLEAERNVFQCPNLIQLKIRCPKVELFRLFCNPESLPRLKEVSYIFDRELLGYGPYYDLSQLQLPELFRLLDCHHQTMTSFGFLIIKKKTNYGHDGVPLYPIEFGCEVKFRKVKHLTIHLYIIVREKEWRPVISALFRKFPEVEQITVLGNHFQIGPLPFLSTPMKNKVKEAVDQLWAVVHEKVTSVLMPGYGKLVLERGEQLSLEMMEISG